MYRAVINGKELKTVHLNDLMLMIEQYLETQDLERGIEINITEIK